MALAWSSSFFHVFCRYLLSSLGEPSPDFHGCGPLAVLASSLTWRSSLLLHAGLNALETAMAVRHAGPDSVTLASSFPFIHFLSVC